MKYAAQWNKKPMNTIYDDLTRRKISGAAKCHIRRKRAGMCPVCGKPAGVGIMCPKHARQARERQRRRTGARRRYLFARSYQEAR